MDVSYDRLYEIVNRAMASEYMGIKSSGTHHETAERQVMRNGYVVSYKSWKHEAGWFINIIGRTHSHSYSKTIVYDYDFDIIASRESFEKRHNRPLGKHERAFLEEKAFTIERCEGFIVV